MLLPAHAWRWWCAGRNTVHGVVVRQPVRALAVLGVILSVWGLVGGLVGSMLIYLNQPEYLALKPRLMETLLALFCFVLFFLVTISDTVVVWSGLFRSRAATFHAHLPGSDRLLFWVTSLEGGLWASWAVAVLAVPLIAVLVGDALVTVAQQRGGHSDPWLALAAGDIGQVILAILPLLGEGLVMTAGLAAALMAFVLCCVACGAAASLVLARLIPALRRRVTTLIVLGVVALLIGVVLASNGLDRRVHSATFMREIIGRLGFAEHPLLPSWWVQQAMSAALAWRWGDWLHYFLLLISTAAGVAVLAEWYASRRLRQDLDELTGRPEASRSARSLGWRLLPFLPTDLALLIAKDLRLFRRDPAQVLQFTMFFGLLGFYLLMLPRIGQAFLFDAYWRPIVSLLSLTAVAMALATFTGRFVYPMLSLEGRRLWILALAPWPRHRVVTAKFTFALLVGMPVSLALVVLSGVMLDLSWKLVAYEMVVMCCMALGFSAAALGLGARLADYREDNPAKLVAGYGGTVNLLLTLFYATVLLVGAAAPLFAHHAGPWRWVLGLVWALLVTAAWTTWHLRMAWKWFGRFDLVGG